MRTVKIGLVCPNPSDATSFYRAVGPLQHLERSLHRAGRLHLECAEIKASGFKTVGWFDLVLMQRPHSDEHLAWAEDVANKGVPLWLDYDDDLFSVPTDNPAHSQYGDPEVHKNIAKMIAMASHVSVSTEHLKSRLANLNQNISVIPNAIDEWRFGWRNKKDIMRRKVIFWRGSASHQRDVATFSNELIELGNSRSDWTWTFLGYNPWFVTDFMPEKQCIVAPQLEIYEYHDFLHETRPAISIVPLHNNVFNQSKSNIAWLEATFAGAVSVVPDWPEWQRPGTYQYRNPEHFKEVVAELLDRFNHAKERQVMAAQNNHAWEYIRENLILGVVNHEREQIIMRLADLRPQGKGDV